ncbi:hypothetical protein MACH09_37750 [Vibrio sp. MACH09]|nr:hypothetical protein MACH09_37750 [Vibrio sp. MACH09]
MATPRVNNQLAMYESLAPDAVAAWITIMMELVYPTTMAVNPAEI